MFCLQIHARAECTMNEKFCTLHEAARAESLTHLIYNLSSLVVLASKSRSTLSLTKQNKTNAILKTLYVKKVQQI